jgi:hypothetical protein
MFMPCTGNVQSEFTEQVLRFGKIGVPIAALPVVSPEQVSVLVKAARYGY